MGTADIVTKEYMRENTVFADAFNYLIYNGKKVIDPAKLKEIDPTEIALPFDDEEKAGKEKDGEDKNRKAQGTEWSSVKNESVRKKTAGRAGKKTDAVQRYRDLLKFAVIKQDERTSYVLLGIENQTDVHYAMPVRNAIYDALQYGRQVADIAAGHRRNKNDFSGKNNGEYLLSLGVTGYNQDTFEVYHRLYDALNITVVSDKNTVGYYDMDSETKVWDAEEK